MPKKCSAATFLSTPSARRATPCPLGRGSIAVYFYPRPPRGGRLCAQAPCLRRLGISIHALREEGDVFGLVSSPPVYHISIHALREEGDHWSQKRTPGAKEFLSTPSARRATRSGGSDMSDEKNFYPRPPRGGRPPRFAAAQTASSFLSTPSARRATDHHAGRLPVEKHFYPRPPRGGRPGIVAMFSPPYFISIHALREEGDHRAATM